MKVCTKQRMNSSTFLMANAICFWVTEEIKEPISMRSDSISFLETRTQFDTKLCEPLLFYFYLMSFVYEENVKNIMNCIVLVQISPDSPSACFSDTIK